MEPNYMAYAQAINQAGNMAPALSTIGQAFDDRQSRRDKEILMQRDAAQTERQNRLSDLQMEAGQLNLDQDRAKSLATIAQYGTEDRPDFQTQLADAQSFQNQEAQMLAQKEKQQANVKQMSEMFFKVSEAIDKDILDETTGKNYFDTHIKMLGIDPQANGFDIAFKKGSGGFYSGPVNEKSLFMVNGKPTPYGATGIVEGAKIVGVAPDGSSPIFAMEKGTKFVEPKQDNKGFDTIDLGDKIEVVPRNGGPSVIKKKAIPPAVQIKLDREDKKTAKAEKKAARDDANSIAAIDQSIATAKKLAEHPGREQATGKSRIFQIQNVYGTDAYDFEKELESFDAQLFLSNIQSMKGMGALSNAEGAKVSAAAGAIKPGMKEESFLANINTIEKTLQLGRDRIAKGIVVNPDGTIDTEAPATGAAKPAADKRPPLSAIFGKKK